MSTLLIMICAFVGYLIMYNLYGKFVGRKIFALDPEVKVPSVELEDGVDYVPTRKEVIFGHHYTSIAGTGPIVGPAIAIIWGWLPALIWVFVGSIMMGAVHDLGALIISMRNQGKSIAEYTAKYVNPRTKFYFFVIAFLELWIVIAIFGMIIAIIFSMYPQSVFPVWMEIPLALLLGYMVYKKGKGITAWSIYAIIAMYVTVLIGVFLPIKMPVIAGIPSIGIWVIILLIYAFIASVLPVTTLLQPRDYINAHELVIAMALLVIGVFASAFGGKLHIVAPAIQSTPAGAPPLWPFLFITIACGAISGFHCLVASGTTSKQVRNETDSLFVGYGSMLMEAALATLVIVAVAAGIGIGYTAKSGQVLTGVSAWTAHYSSWAAAAGLGSKITAFVVGSANMMTCMGIPLKFAIVIMGVFVASFAGTTLDTATRCQRYIVTELFTDIKANVFKNRYVATAFVVITAGILAFSTGASGEGALTLWPLFGAVNQTLAALALIIVTLYLKGKGGLKWLVSGIPALFMIVMTFWATLMNEGNFIKGSKGLLVVINAVVIILVVLITIEGVIKFFGKRQEA